MEDPEADNYLVYPSITPVEFIIKLEDEQKQKELKFDETSRLIVSDSEIEADIDALEDIEVIFSFNI